MKTPLLAACFLLVFGANLALGADERKTNVIFILTDNHGAWTMGCYGNPDIKTPNIDRMAKEGIRFDRAFCNNAVCSPTRATYLTGLMPSQHGVHNFLRRSPLQMGPDARNTLEEFTSLPEVLKSNGYACGLVGKWHLGNNLEPNEGLDDYWITMPHGGTSTFHDATVIENGEERTEPTYLTDLWTDHALKFIDQNKDNPFFLYLAYNGPYGLSDYQLESSGNRHAEYYADKEMTSFPRGVNSPWQFSNRAYFGNETSIRRYAEELSAVDDGVGAVLEKLQTLGLDENTLVVFTADQGWAGGQRGIWGMGDHTRPVNAFEHSMRIPLVFRHPGKIPADRVTDLATSNYDFMPTVLGYLRLGDQMPAPSGAADDVTPKSPGRDYSPELRGDKIDRAKWGEAVFYEYESLRCIRDGNWKLVDRYDDADYHELYDLKADPEELNNLYGKADHADSQAGLQKKLDAFFAEHAYQKYDLWIGGTSQTAPHVWGKTIDTERQQNLAANRAFAPSAIDPSWNPSPIELPDGLIAEVAAAPPLVQHPTMAAFDDRGRLFVSENAGLNLNNKELDEQKPNSIRVLEDRNNDGLFDTSTVFADNMTFPQGALWLHDALYVMSPPSLWRLEDTTGDNVADVREELVTGFDYTGNAADVHGPFLHPNGRIYWCHGRKGHEVYDPKTGELVNKGKASGIWSCNPDGSDVQFFAGAGADNPTEVIFTESGEIIGDVNLFYGRPRGDVLVHWLRGGAYPRHDQAAVTAELIRTGPLLKEVHNFGHVGVSGVARVSNDNAVLPGLAGSDALNILVCHFNTQKITNTILRPEGSTWRSDKTETVVQFKDPDVHVTDVLEDANGDILVVDTGGWFRNGCPTSQVAKPDIAGAIYRIRRAGVRDRQTDFYGTQIDWENADNEQLVSLLDHPIANIREKAISEMAIRGEPSLAALEEAVANQDATATVRRNAVWTLARMQFSDASDALLGALGDRDASVRQAASNALAATRTRQLPLPGETELSEDQQVKRQRDLLIAAKLSQLIRADDSPAVVRAAASALGRVGEEDAVGALLGVAGREGHDRAAMHSMIYSLIEINNPERTRLGLEAENPLRQSVALIALDQMRSGELEALTTLPFLSSEYEPLRQTAIDVILRHADWDAALANRFHDWLDAATTIADIQGEVIAALAPRFLETPPMRSLVAQLLDTGNPEVIAIGLRAIADSDTSKFDDAWKPGLERTLSGDDETTFSAALDALGQARTDAFDDQLKALAADKDRTPLIRVRALRAMVGSDKPLGQAGFDLLASMISPEASPQQRLDAAQMLGSARLTKEQMVRVAKLTEFAGPLDLPALLKQFDAGRIPEVGQALAVSLPKSIGIGNITATELQTLMNRYDAEIYNKIKPTIDDLLARGQQQAERLVELEALVAQGDPERGHSAYIAGKGACITCHKVGDEGRAVGPDLSTIGRIRSERDLLESILYPSESLARDFETWNVTLNDGNIHFGLIQRETKDTVYVTNPAAQEIAVPRKDIKSIDSIAVSLMPQGLDQAMTQEELLDIVAFLKSRQ